ncbi:THUMP-like domain-containing protein [Nonlabens xiamenensis]|uniref:THUMP-like domain-containing protein n=1 Tax=Nonlabens xiamenensis TaxID=2341043 RepID=UPI000F60555D|nr:methyltransferase [Nonlabens xiamenensis]
MNKLAISKEVDAYLREHLHEHPADFMLRSHPFPAISAQELTQQLVGLQKAKNKFPFLFERQDILYPPKLNLEQTSSQTAATYKAMLFPSGTMVDLTGGFGIDVCAFAKAGYQTTHIEYNAELQPYAAHLLEVQGLDTQSICMDGMKFIQQTEKKYDLIFADPSRKTEAKSKAVLLEDYEPNLVGQLDLIFNKTRRLMIKTSPMLDITAGLQQLPQTTQVHIVAIKNEVKELLWILEPKTKRQPQIFCVNLQSDQSDFSARWSQNNLLADYRSPQNYLYEPNAAIMKSQLFDALQERYLVYKLNRDSHFFTSNELIQFPGRCFEVVRVLEAKPKQIKKLYAGTSRAVVSRNFRMSVMDIRKKYKMGENEQEYLFFTEVAGMGAVVIEARKL